MRRIKYIMSAALASVSMNMAAQSTDAAYPENIWMNDYPGIVEDRPYSIYIEVKRVIEPNSENNGRKDCGSIEVTDNKTEKDIISGFLTYAGKGMKDNMGDGVYYFDIATDKGTTSKVGLKRVGEGNMAIVSLTGLPADHPLFKEKCFTEPGRTGSYIPVGAYAETEKDMLDCLRSALNDYDKERIAERTRGYGDVKQYINAHAKLDPTKPKYLKSKSGGAVNIRESRSTSAAKIGEVKAGQTLLVIDEYDGWCQVDMGNGQKGWVSLSVVTLTNTPAAAAGAAQQATTVQNPVNQGAPLTADGHLCFLGISLNEKPAAFISQLMAKGFKKEWGEGGMTSLSGKVEGTKTKVMVHEGTVKGQPGCLYQLRVIDDKTYKLSQAKSRLQQLVATMESFYGKSKATPSEFVSGVSDYVISVGSGCVTISIHNEDEMDGASDFYIVEAILQDWTDN